MLVDNAMFISEKTKESEDVVWQLVPPSLRPSLNESLHRGPDSLFLVRQDWRIELVGLTESGRLDIRELNTKEPMLFALLS